MNFPLAGRRAFMCAAFCLCLTASGGSIALAKSPDLAALAARAAATVEQLHRNASKALVTAAQDRAFGSYFAAHDHGERQKSKARIDRVSLSVQERFHVEEMCLIDPNGAEISRIVGKEIAHDLATDEADALFFAPGFDTDHRKVYISPIYMSPDAAKWVVAYVTPVLVDGQKKSILHYEHSLSAYSTILARQAQTLGAKIMVVNDAGYVIFDSRRQIPMEKVGEKEDLGDYFEAFSFAGRDLAAVKAELGASRAHGKGKVEGPGGAYSVAFRQVGRWTIIAWEEI